MSTSMNQIIESFRKYAKLYGDVINPNKIQYRQDQLVPIRNKLRGLVKNYLSTLSTDEFKVGAILYNRFVEIMSSNVNNYFDFVNYYELYNPDDELACDLVGEITQFAAKLIAKSDVWADTHLPNVFDQIRETSPLYMLSSLYRLKRDNINKYVMDNIINFEMRFAKQFVDRFINILDYTSTECLVLAHAYISTLSNHFYMFEHILDYLDTDKINELIKKLASNDFGDKLVSKIANYSLNLKYSDAYTNIDKKFADYSLKLAESGISGERISKMFGIHMRPKSIPRYDGQVVLGPTAQLWKGVVQISKNGKPQDKYWTLCVGNTLASAKTCLNTILKDPGMDEPQRNKLTNLVKRMASVFNPVENPGDYPKYTVLQGKHGNNIVYWIRYINEKNNNPIWVKCGNIFNTKNKMLDAICLKKVQENIYKFNDVEKYVDDFYKKGFVDYGAVTPFDEARLFAKKIQQFKNLSGDKRTKILKFLMIMKSSNIDLKNLD